LRRSQWLQNGYRIPKDATDSLKCVEYVDEKRTISAYYHEKLRPGARVGVTYKNAESLFLCGLPAFVLLNGSSLALFVGRVMLRRKML